MRRTIPAIPMSCVKCGAEIAPGASECPRCGVLVSKARSRPPGTGPGTGPVPTVGAVPAVAPLPSLDDSRVTAPSKPPKAPFGQITETMVESLENTRSWVRIIAVSSGFAFLGLVGVGLYAYLYADAVSTKLGNRFLISFIAAISACAFSFLLLKDYSNAIERLRGDQPTSAMEDAIVAQERIWRVQGALTLLGWMLAVFLLALWRTE